jgi:GH25 family lysozyme M1 (1,4-beta-N-acetylmuramidase)
MKAMLMEQNFHAGVATARRHRQRAFLPALLMLLALAMTVCGSGRAMADVSCDNGAEVRDAGLCAFFVKRTNPATTVTDDRITSRIPSHDSDPPIRSFALIVAVHSYPNFADAKDRVLAAAEADRKNLEDFFDRQKFDEIIVLEDGNATKDNIDYFLGTYLSKQADIYRKRSRIVFAFSGHGAPGDRDGPGSLVLSKASGATDYDNLYTLDQLAPVLRALGRKSFHFVALMGSCFSGGIFTQNDNSGDNIFYAKAPGAHAVSAAKANELAYAVKDQSGSIFFHELIEGVSSGYADLDYSNLVQDANGGLHPRGGGIVRLGALEGYLTSMIGGMGKNPDTGEDFPRPLLGRIVNAPDSGGAFFFLGPDVQKTIVISQPGGQHALQKLGIEPAKVANAVAKHPELKLFNAPDTYAVQGVDVSHFEGDIDWRQLGGGALQFAYMKATQASTFKDEKFEKNWSAAREAGLIPGAYHVFSFCKPAQEQFNLINGVVPKDNAALPIAIDIEWVHGPAIRGEEACKDIPTVKKSLRELAQLLRTAYGKKPVLHGFTSTFADLIDQDFVNAIWLQDFRKTGGQSGPALLGSNAWSIWQYSSKAIIPGIKTPVDVNAFFGTREDFQKFVATGDNVAKSTGE